MAGLPRNSPHITSPYILEVYAVPDDDLEEAILPMPAWLHAIFEGTAAQFSVLRENIEDIGDWGLYADVIRFRELHTILADLRSRLQVLQDHIKGTENARDACRSRLELAGLTTKAFHLRVLAPIQDVEQRARFGYIQRRGR